MREIDDPTVWKVGELARATGLTVRTLHHWDELGLVQPSARTASGHRLYDDADVRRVYAVVVLRELGLPLETIGAVLAESDVDLGQLLAAHLRHVRAEARALQALATRLSALVTRVRNTDSPRTPELLRMIDEVSRMNEAVRNYFTKYQLAVLKARREHLGPDQMDARRDEWLELTHSMTARMAAGTDPADARVQRLGQRWMALLDMFDGGDPQLRAANDRRRRENPIAVETAGGPSAALLDYIELARQ